MEVPLPEFQFQSRFNFSNLEELAKELEENQIGSYFQKLTEFVNFETRRLRERFMPRDEYEMENLDDYEQVWAASSDLIKRSWELTWCSRFKWDDIERGALELEEMEMELNEKCCNFKEEVDSLGEKTLYLSSCIMIVQKFMDMQRLLDEMVLKIYPLFKRDFGAGRIRSEVNKFCTRMDMLHKYDERIAGRLRWEILMQQYRFDGENLAESIKASTRLVRDILPMGQVISFWNKQLQEDASKFKELVMKLGPKQGQENIDLLQLVDEMQETLILPRQYYAVFEHPKRDRIPIDML